jgi:hypothetical protein
MDIASARNWNPRYVAYALENGRTPAEQLAHDKAQYPGACMVLFLVWRPLSESSR